MNTKSTDLTKYRRLKKRQNYLKKIIIMVVIVTMLFVIYITRDKWAPFLGDIVSEYRTTIVNDGKLATGNFPIKTSISSSYNLSATDNNFLLLTDTHLIFYNENGQKEFVTQHKFSNPVIKQTDKRVLLYDIGGTSFMHYSKNKKMFEKELSNKILLARISKDNYTSVVTQSDKYISEMKVYNKNGEEIFYAKGNNRIIDVAFNKDSTGCVATSLYAKDGQIACSLICYDFSKTVERWSSNAINTLVLTTNIMSNGKISVVGDDRFTILSEKGEILKTFIYDSPLVSYASFDNVTALLFEDDDLKTHKLSIISENGKESTISFDHKVNCVKIYDNIIYLLTNKKIMSYNVKGDTLATAELSEEYTDFAVVDDHIYLLGYQDINRINFKT